MLKKKKLFLLIIVILVLPVMIMYADLTGISASDVIITIDIPHDENINIINFSFDLTSPTSAFIVKTIDDDPNAGVLTFTSGSVDTWDGEDEQGFLISYVKSSNTYTFTVQKKPVYDPPGDATRGNIDTEGPQLSLYISNLSGPYTITSPATGTCYDIANQSIPTTPEVLFSFCVPVVNIDYIQLENGNTVTAEELTSIHTTTDDSVNIYANAYDSSNVFLGPVYVDWKFSNSTFDGDDIAPDFGEATEFSPDNTGASNISVEYRYDFETDKVLSDSYSVSAAGEFSSLKIVDSNKAEITTKAYSLSNPPADDIVLYAAEFDSGNNFRKYVSASWSVKDLDNNSVISSNIFNPAIGENVTLNPVCNLANPAAGDYIITARHNTVDNCNDADYCDSTGTITILAKDNVDTYVIRMHDIVNDEYIDVPESFEPGTSAVELAVFGYDDCGNPKGMQNINWCIKTQNFSDGASGSFTGNVITATGNSVIYLPPANESGTAVIEVRTDACGSITATADSVEITINTPPPAPSGIRIFTSSGSDDFIVDQYFTAASGSDLGLWAGTIDADGEYIQDIVVTWSTPSLWAQHDPLPPIPSETADFIHNNAPGYSEIMITHPDYSSYIGQITILPHQPVSPYNVVHVLDRSGSMRQKAYAETGSPTKMDTVKDAADYFVNLMQAESSNGYGLIVFDNQSDTLVPSVGTLIQDLTIGIKDYTIQNTIPGISPGGSTTIGGGLIDGLSLLPDTSSNQSILLLSDGRHNSAPPISDFVNAYNSRTNKIPVHMIGLGYDVGYQSSQLAACLADIGGNGTLTHIASQADLPIKLFKVFNQILTDTADQDLLDDPVYELHADSEPIKIPIEITADMSQAAFSVFWSGADKAVDIEIISPSGIVFNHESSNNRIKIGLHENYIFFDLHFPLSDHPDEKIGTWIFAISPSDNLPENNTIILTSAVSATGGLKIDTKLDTPVAYAGNPITLTAKLSDNGKPLRGLDVRAELVEPLNSYANIICKSKIVNPKPIGQPFKGSSSWLPPWILHTGLENSIIDRQIQMIERLINENLIKYSSSSLKLYDDGKHEDGQANDGIYANTYDDLKIPGAYNFRIVADDIPIGEGRTSSIESAESLYSMVNISPLHSEITKELIKEDLFSKTYHVTFTPKDKYENYLGPGYPLAVLLPDSIKMDGIKNISNFVDHLDGTYSLNLVIKNRIPIDPKWIKLLVTPPEGDIRVIRSFELSDIFKKGSID